MLLWIMGFIGQSLSGDVSVLDRLMSLPLIRQGETQRFFK